MNAVVELVVSFGIGGIVLATIVGGLVGLAALKLVVEWVSAHPAKTVLLIGMAVIWGWGAGLAADDPVKAGIVLLGGSVVGLILWMLSGALFIEQD